MLKVSQNQIDFQTAANIYQRGLSTLKIALGLQINAIEARKLAWMAGCASLLHLFQTGGDPYCAMASAISARCVSLSLGGGSAAKAVAASNNRMMSLICSW